MKKLKPESDQTLQDQQRRNFVKKSTLVGVGVAAAATLPATAVAVSSDNELSDTSQQKGYQVTQHVIDYYKSAAV